MTLYRQLLIFTLVLFVVLFVGVWVEKLQSTRSFLITQLESHAQDTATSLGLSLSPVMAENDMSTAETMMNAVFDRGYYKTIRLDDVYGDVLSERTLEIGFEGVPAWFVKMVPLATPSAEALVMAGWSQAGTLLVESHPGYAYRALWGTVVKISLYFLVAGFVVLVFGALGLRYLLKPLKQVEQQAEAICRKEYNIQEDLPRTRELRQVVTSMNRMTAKVKDMFTEQARVAERLRKNAYSDPLTGLGNRRYMTGQVEAHLEASKKDVSNGALFMLQVVGLQEINEKDGFAAGDSLLKKVSDIIKAETRTISQVALARLTGGDFAIFMSEISSSEAIVVAENLSKGVTKLAAENASHSDNLAHVGGVVYEETPTLPQLLSEADNSLHSARQAGPNKWVVNRLASQETDVVKGKSWWKETLEDVIERRDIILYGQPVVSSRDESKILHQEVLSRISLKSGEIVSAGIFIPLAERLGMVSKLDFVVLNKVIEHVAEGKVKDRVAVNVSPSSLADKEFVEWVTTKLFSLSSSSQIIFELPEFGAVQYLDAVKDFSKKVQEIGHGIGLDHFGQSFSNFGYLKSLRPEYVKIDRAFTKELERDHGDSEFFIEALAGVAHSLDIQVIAEGVEKKEQVETLIELNVDALQGYLFSEPKQI